MMTFVKGEFKMCKECRQYRCPPGCPNYEEEQKVYGYCSDCFSPIYEGDDYFLLGDEVYCEDCVINGRREAGC